MIPNRNIPSYCLWENGRRVKVEYPGQSFTCARCHQVSKGCKGNGNASRCKKAGGHRVKLQDYWKFIIGRAPRTGQIEEDDVIEADWIMIDGIPEGINESDIQNHLKQHTRLSISQDNILRDSISHNSTLGTVFPGIVFCRTVFCRIAFCCQGKFQA